VSSHRRQIAARREMLRARSQRLRGQLADDAAALGKRFELADRIVAAARSGAGRPLLIGAAALLLFNRPRRLLRLAVKALTLWPVIVPLVPHVKRLLATRYDRGPAAE
jgi:YqjK-like protein